MKKLIQKRIEELSLKVQSLVEEREAMAQRIDEINVEVAQTVGAIQELDALLKEEEPQE
jgi:hypothetical protein